MNDAPGLVILRDVAFGYLAVGAVVCLLHPKIIRGDIAALKDLELGVAGWLFKPIMALLGFLFACLVWPLAWFNVGKAEKRRQARIAAQLARIRSIEMLYTAMNAPVTYTGGDGSSFEQAVILVGATLVSGPRAAYDFIEQRYPGFKHGRQLLKEQNGRSYDVLEFTTADGEIRTMYFDISAHFRAGGSETRSASEV